jgi:hypothetical protein
MLPLVSWIASCRWGMEYRLLIGNFHGQLGLDCLNCRRDGGKL